MSILSGLTKENVVYKPFSYAWAMNKAVEHEKMHWHEGEARLNDDVVQWKTGKIGDKEKSHITSILQLFTQTDVVVGSNYLNEFIPYFKNNEVRAMLTSFASREFVHQRAYALLNDTLGLNEKEYSSFLANPVLKAKVDGMTASPHYGIEYSLMQTICNEGMSLFSAFVMLLNYQRTGKMKGMCEIVEWSIKDESFHVEGMLELFNTHLAENNISRKHLEYEAHAMFQQAVEHEDAAIDYAYSNGGPDDLTKEEVKHYVRYLADRRLIQMGFSPAFGVKDNPIPWLDWVVNGDSFKNFFEGVVTDYSSGGLVGEWEYAS